MIRSLNISSAYGMPKFYIVLYEMLYKVFKQSDSLIGCFIGAGPNPTSLTF